MNFEEQLKQKTQEVEQIITTYLPKEEGEQKVVMEAVNYSMQAGGKRLRPLIMLEVYRLFGGEKKTVEPFLTAMEMIHTHSLIHDDLPALDNDDFRRGKPTTHKAYGEDIAILAGDVLLNYSMETALQAFQFETKESVILGLQTLYKKSGMYGMLGGQVVDVQTDKTGEITKEKIDFIYDLKTGALLEASFMLGGILAGATEEEVDTLQKIGKEIGLAFQIQDDILDIVGSFEELGKPVGSDEKNKKATYVTYEGLEQAKQDVIAHTDEAILALRGLQKDSAFLEELLLSLVNRKN